MSDCPTCGYPAPCGRCEEFLGYQWPHEGDLVVVDYPDMDELWLAAMAHGEAHEARGERAEDCLGPDCPLNAETGM